MRLVFLNGLVLSVGLCFAAVNKLVNQYPVGARVSVESEADGTFTAQLMFKNQTALNHWDFGFFMLRVLVNPEIPFNAQICVQKTNKCSSLIIDKNPQARDIHQFLLPDLSVGHFSLFTPTTPFPLRVNTTYLITIRGLHNIPQNITAMPQKLFIYNLDRHKLINMHVIQYLSKEYNVSASQVELATTINRNWQTSKTILTTSVVVPLPVSTTLGFGTYTLPSGVNIYTDPLHNKVASLIAIALNKDMYLNAKLRHDNPTTSEISLILCNSKIDECRSIQSKPEGYVLDIGKGTIILYANTNAGFFYAFESLRQLWNYFGPTLPQQIIVDYPRFKYRGIMLDVVRHFYSPGEIKLLLDVMAAHKLNTLHLHLADDEGWRIELPNYPELTTIGSKRGLGYKIGPANLISDKFDTTNYLKQVYANSDTVYQGYYTTTQIKQLIKYANMRQITIIPEIEMPGHARAMKKAMPKVFFAAADRSNYYSVQGYNDNVLPICKYNQDQNFTQTINSISIAIANLFSGQSTFYAVNKEISLAGDEVPPTALQGFNVCHSGQWTGLTTNQIMHLFFKDLANNLVGYKLSGWQQIVQNDDGTMEDKRIASIDMGHIWEWMPTSNSTISGIVLASNLAKAGYPVVLDFADLTYFDMRYTSQWSEPGLYWASNSTDTYTALSSGWISNKVSNPTQVLGIEGALWSELLPNAAHLFYMATPKMAGLAEAAWSDKNSLSWQSLATRLGCGKSGFLSYLNKVYAIRYRGYPNGIKLEVPKNGMCKE